MRAQAEPTPAAHRQAEDSAAGFSVALKRLVSITAFAVLPALVLVTMALVGHEDGSFADDFHHEIYPQAEEMLAGRNPYPAPDFDPTVAPNFIWPPIVAFLHAPLTALPAGAADLVMVFLGLALFALALWLVGARDWRVYGVLALWPQVAGEMRVSHLTPALCVLAALTWRTRDARLAPGITAGAAIALKFFVWPLGLWLASIRRYSAALVAVSLAGASLLLVLPFTSLDGYIRALLQLGRGFDQDSYTLFGLVVQSGGAESMARIVTFAAGVLLLAGTWRYRSFTLALAAALTLSPIVWLDYFAVAAVPLAIVRPRLSPVWFLPIATWGMSGAGIDTGDAPETIRLLVVFAIVFAVAFRAEREPRTARVPVEA